MFFSKTLALALAFAPAILGAPTPSQSSADISALERRALSPDVIRKLSDGVCDLSKAAMPLGTSLLSPPLCSH